MIAQSLLSQSTGCIGVICAQDNINQTTSYLYALEKQLSQHQKHLLLRFANTSSGVMNSLVRGLSQPLKSSTAVPVHRSKTASHSHCFIALLIAS